MNKRNITNQNKAYFFALVAVLFWSTVSSAFKITLRYLSFDIILFWSVFTGTFFLTVVIALSKAGFNQNDFGKKSLLSSAIMGFINPFLYYLLLLKGYDLLDAQEAGIINYIWIIFLVLFSIIFLKQKIKPMGLAALLISFAGTLIVITRGDFSKMRFSSLSGVLLIITAAALFAFYWILNMKDKRDDVKKIWMNLGFGLLYITVYQLFIYKKIVIPSLEGLLGSIYIGLFEISITFVIWLKALQHSEDTAKVGNLIFLSPFLALFWINRAVGETIRLSTIAGLVLIVAGIILQKFYGAKKV